MSEASARNDMEDLTAHNMLPDSLEQELFSGRRHEHRRGEEEKKRPGGWASIPELVLAVRCEALAAS